MPIEQSVLLADFARTCKAAARAVSLYPGTHPAIATSLSRLVASTGRLARSGPVKFGVQRDLLAIDGRSPLRPDASIGELATLLHDRLIGRLTVQPQADAEDWRALLLLLARTPDDLIAEGGIGKAWSLTGRRHFEIQEIDYAEVLRERGGGDDADWDRIIEYCLRGESRALDDGAVASLLEALGDPARFAKLLEQLQEATGPDTTKVAARVAAILRLMRTAIEAARTRGEEEVDRAIGTIAAACASLTPDTMLGMLEQRQGPNQEDASLVSTVVERMTDRTMATFMARAVAAERGATERLAHALDSLAPAKDRKGRIVDLAKAEAMEGELGADPGFEQLWQNVTNTVMSYSLVAYSDEPYVSAQYAKELSATRQHAIEVERVSDDPPERVRGWTATVSEPALDQLDLQMLLDLLRIEDALPQWEPLATIAASEIERRALIGDISGARALLEALVRETKGDGRSALSAAASRLMDRVAVGPLARHVALHFRTVNDAEVDQFNHV